MRALRRRYYGRLLGKRAGALFAEIEEKCEGFPNGPPFARQVLDWIQEVAEADREEALELAWLKFLELDEAGALFRLTIRAVTTFEQVLEASHLAPDPADGAPPPRASEKRRKHFEDLEQARASVRANQQRLQRWTEIVDKYGDPATILPPLPRPPELAWERAPIRVQLTQKDRSAIFEKRFGPAVGAEFTEYYGRETERGAPLEDRLMAYDWIRETRPKERLSAIGFLRLKRHGFEHDCDLIRSAESLLLLEQAIELVRSRLDDGGITGDDRAASEARLRDLEELHAKELEAFRAFNSAKRVLVSAYDASWTEFAAKWGDDHTIRDCEASE